MAWVSARPVPWKRLSIEWLVIGVGIGIVSLAFTNNRDVPSFIAMVVLGGLVYFTLGFVLAKFGYARKSLRQMRAEAAAAPPRQVGRSAPTARQRPAPTKRTSTGPSQKPRKGSRR
ncbi:MAG: hypothetical protein Q7V88_03885 [Actinomycetota bacterium]|nr:hypothetical protein [Actinomycetota bacterium]